MAENLLLPPKGDSDASHESSNAPQGASNGDRVENGTDSSQHYQQSRKETNNAEGVTEGKTSSSAPTCRPESPKTQKNSTPREGKTSLTGESNSGDTQKDQAPSPPAVPTCESTPDAKDQPEGDKQSTQAQ